MKIHEKYIKRCLQLAKNGLGLTRPNPMVGCVIVCEGVVIGEGFTSPYGGSHAEVNAINSVTDKGKLQNATLYVSLEPCNHYGKTPPCSDLIAKHRLQKVVVGCVDPFEAVAGKGIEKIKNSGIEVVVGVLEDECIAVNRRFFTFHNKKRPYIILKWAETKDGFIAPLNRAVPNKPVWITNIYSRQLVHKWRAEEPAILVGTNTVLEDNPKLDVRDWSGESPLRLVLDKNNRLPHGCNVFDGSNNTVMFNENDNVAMAGVVRHKINFANDVPKQICDYLYQSEIQSLIIEGGAKTLQSFIENGFWDEARVFIGNSNFFEGIKAPYIIGEEVLRKEIKSDVLKFLFPKK